MKFRYTVTLLATWFSGTLAMTTSARRSLFRISIVEETKGNFFEVDKSEHSSSSGSSIGSNNYKNSKFSVRNSRTHSDRRLNTVEAYSALELKSLFEEGTRSLFRQINEGWDDPLSWSLSFSLSMSMPIPPSEFSMSLSMSMPWLYDSVPFFSRRDLANSDPFEHKEQPVVEKSTRGQWRRQSPLTTTTTPQAAAVHHDTSLLSSVVDDSETLIGSGVTTGLRPYRRRQGTTIQKRHGPNSWRASRGSGKLPNQYLVQLSTATKPEGYAMATFVIVGFLVVLLMMSAQVFLASCTKHFKNKSGDTLHVEKNDEEGSVPSKGLDVMATIPEEGMLAIQQKQETFAMDIHTPS